MRAFLAGAAFIAVVLALKLAVPPRITDEEAFRQVTLARRAAWSRQQMITGAFIVQSSVSYMVVGANGFAVGDAIASLDTGCWGTIIKAVPDASTGGTKTALWVKWAPRGDWPTVAPQAGEAFIRLQGRPPTPNAKS